MFTSPLRAADAGIDRQHNHRNIGEVAALQHLDQRRDIGQSRGPDTGPHEELGAITLEVVDQFSPGLLGPHEILPIRCSLSP